MSPAWTGGGPREPVYRQGWSTLCLFVCLLLLFSGLQHLFAQRLTLSWHRPQQTIPISPEQGGRPRAPGSVPMVRGLTVLSGTPHRLCGWRSFQCILGSAQGTKVSLWWWRAERLVQRLRCCGSHFFFDSLITSSLQ